MWGMEKYWDCGLVQDPRKTRTGHCLTPMPVCHHGCPEQLTLCAARMYCSKTRLLVRRRYVNQPEPPLKSHSVTVKADAAKIADMHARAADTFSPALAALMRATPEPFINAIFDREPLQRWVFGRCVLVGEAAHPTTPHGLRCAARARRIGEAPACTDGNPGPAGGRWLHEQRGIACVPIRHGLCWPCADRRECLRGVMCRAWADAWYGSATATASMDDGIAAAAALTPTGHG